MKILNREKKKRMNATRVARAGLVLLAALLTPSGAHAADPNSLKVAKAATSSVDLSWTDPTVTVTCILRDLTFPMATVIGQSIGLTYRDTPPAGNLWFYQVNEPPGGICTVATCAPTGALPCGGSVSGDTTSGATSVNAYPSCGVLDATGPELVYDVMPTQDLSMTATLSTSVSGLSLFVLEDSGLGCDPATCVASGMSPMWSAVAGRTYHIAVDGRSGAVGPFQLNLACAGGRCSLAGTIACGGSDTSRNDAAGSTIVIRDYAGCSVTDATGPERTYAFVPTTDGSVTATLSNLTANLDLFVLEDPANLCDPTTCIATGDTMVTWSAVAGRTYHIVVDGRAGAVSGYTLSLACTGGGGSCLPLATPVTCATPASGNNGGAGSTNVLPSYPCAPGVNASGPEQVYTFAAPPTGGNVTATLSGTTADLDLFVLTTPGAACAAANCIAHGDTSVTFPTIAGSTYAIVVDGVAGAVSNYTLSLTCGTATSCGSADTLICNQSKTSRNDEVGSTNAVATYPCAPTWNESGPEFTYSFTPSVTGVINLALTTTGPDLDVLVLDGSGVCSAGSCIASGDNGATFNATAGNTYYVVVDGRNGAVSGFNLTTTCPPPIPGTCVETSSLGCGSVEASDTRFAGSTNANASYPCAPGRDESGPERTHLLVLNQTQLVTVSLLNLAADLDIFVLEQRGNGCRPADCVAWGDTSVTFQAQAGSVYYLVVDGHDGAASDYRILVSCSPVPGQCAPGATLTCGQNVSGRNDQAGSTDVIPSWDACSLAGALDETGPEYAYTFVATQTGSVTATLTNTTGDFFVHVIADAAGCDPLLCTTTGFGGVTWSAVAGTTYRIVVDGYRGSVGGYDLTLTCN